jgi:hypothetical protein
MWKLDENHTTREDIVIFEVMIGEVDGPSWRKYRHELEDRFRQDVIVIRAQETRLL